MKIIVRNIFLISLNLLVLLASSGVLLSKHYCLGRLKSVSYFQKANNCCGEGNEETMPCCENVDEFLKLDTFHHTSLDFDFQPTASLPLMVCFQLLETEPTREKHLTLHNLALPPPPKRSFVLLYQNFRI